MFWPLAQTCDESHSVMSEHDRMTFEPWSPSWSGCICVNNNDWVSVTRYCASYSSVSFCQTGSDRRVHLSTLTEETGSRNCRPDHETNQQTRSVHKEAREAPGSTRKHACGDTTKSHQQSPVFSGLFTWVSTNIGYRLSIRVSSSVIPLYTVP